MQFLALASDYDGTLAHDGVVAPETLAAVRRLKESGRRFLLVTGRELPELQMVFPDFALCDLIVAENGALLFTPATGELKPLAAAPPVALVTALKRRGVTPLSVGNVIVATREPYEKAVLEAIRELGLELQIIFNKGAVMVLPSGINKASGLTAALGQFDFTADRIIGCGDAENDHAFLALCGCGVAVANALPMLKRAADVVTKGARGAGVAEIIDQILAGGEAALLKARELHLAQAELSGAKRA
jgi:hydroxymethylpyrimidine pyrophosphatase-like HAD family hydrolase